MSKGNKRVGLAASTAAATAVSAKESGQSMESNPKDETYTGNGVHLRKSDWKMLRRVAEARVDIAGGGRPSVSKVIERLIEDNRQALESELLKQMTVGN